MSFDFDPSKMFQQGKQYLQEGAESVAKVVKKEIANVSFDPATKGTVNPGHILKKSDQLVQKKGVEAAIYYLKSALEAYQGDSKQDKLTRLFVFLRLAESYSQKKEAEPKKARNCLKQAHETYNSLDEKDQKQARVFYQGVEQLLSRKEAEKQSVASEQSEYSVSQYLPEYLGPAVANAEGLASGILAWTAFGKVGKAAGLLSKLSPGVAQFVYAGAAGAVGYVTSDAVYDGTTATVDKTAKTIADNSLNLKQKIASIALDVAFTGIEVAIFKKTSKLYTEFPALKAYLGGAVLINAVRHFRTQFDQSADTLIRSGEFAFDPNLQGLYPKIGLDSVSLTRLLDGALALVSFIARARMGAFRSRAGSGQRGQSGTNQANSTALATRQTGALAKRGGQSGQKPGMTTSLAVTTGIATTGGGSSVPGTPKPGALATMDPNKALAQNDGNDGVGETGGVGDSGDDGNGDDDEITRLAKQIVNSGYDYDHDMPKDELTPDQINFIIKTQLKPKCFPGNSAWLLKLALAMNIEIEKDQVAHAAAYQYIQSSNQRVLPDSLKTYQNLPAIKAFALIIKNLNKEDSKKLQENLFDYYQEELDQEKNSPHYISAIYFILNQQSTLTLTAEQTGVLIKRAKQLNEEVIRLEDNYTDLPEYQDIRLTALIKILSKSLSNGSKYRAEEVVDLLNTLHCNDKTGPSFYIFNIIHDVMRWPQKYRVSFCENNLNTLLLEEWNKSSLSLQEKEIMRTYHDILRSIDEENISPLIEGLIKDFMRGAFLPYSNYPRSLPSILSVMLDDRSDSLKTKFFVKLHIDSTVFNLEEQEAFDSDCKKNYPRWISLAVEAKEYLREHPKEVHAYIIKELKKVFKQGMPPKDYRLFQNLIAFYSLYNRKSFPNLLKELLGENKALKDIPIESLPHQAAIYSIKSYRRVGLEPLGKYLAANMPMQQDFWEDYLDAQDKQAWIDDITDKLQRARMGEKIENGKLDQKKYAYAGLDQPEQLSYQEFSDKYPDKPIPEPFFKARFSQEIDIQSSTHHLLDKGKFKQAANFILPWTDIEQTKELLGDFIDENYTALKPLKGEMDKLFRERDFSKISDKEFKKIIPKLLRAACNNLGEKTPIQIQKLISYLLLFDVFQNSSKTNVTAKSLEGILKKSIDSYELEAYAERIKMFYQEVQAYCSKNGIKLKDIPFLNKKIQLLLKEYKEYEDKKKESGGNQATVHFIPSKAPEDKYFGYVGEDCTTVKGEMIHYSNFQVYRMVSDHRLVGILYLHQEILDGKKVLVIAIQPRSRWKVDYEDLLAKLRDENGPFISAIKKKNYDYLLLMNDRAQQSNRPDMLNAIYEEGLDTIRFQDSIEKELPPKESVFSGNEFLVMWQK